MTRANWIGDQGEDQHRRRRRRPSRPQKRKMSEARMRACLLLTCRRPPGAPFPMRLSGDTSDNEPLVILAAISAASRFTADDIAPRTFATTVAGSRCAPPSGSAHDLIDDTKTLQICRGEFQPRRRLLRFRRIAPQNRSAAFGRCDRVDRVFEHDHVIGDARGASAPPEPPSPMIVATIGTRACVNS